VIELIEAQEGETAITRFLEKNGEGIHHLCYAVADVHAAQKELEGRGYKATWPEPRTGSSNKKVLFLHPRATHGVLIELAQA
jgi:methylmalonyl-CoA/ethylmalonyl-CoA epimerase